MTTEPGPIQPIGRGASRPVPPQPRTVRFGIAILWVGVALAVVFGLLGVAILAASEVDLAALATPEVLGSLALTLGMLAVQAVLLVHAGRGRGWARTALAIFCGMSIALGLATGGGLNVGSALMIGAVVLLFLPPSNAWFAEAERARRG